MRWYKLEEESLALALEAIFQTTVARLEGASRDARDKLIELYVSSRGSLAAVVRNFDHLYIAEELGVSRFAVAGLTHEFREGIYASLARRWAKIVPKIESGGEVYGSLLLPLYFGPTRMGAQWARVAASAALIHHCLGRGNADVYMTLYIIAKIVQRMWEWRKRARRAYRELAMEFAPWGLECRGCISPPDYVDLETIQTRSGERCYKWLLDPYIPSGALGKELHELACSDKPVAIVATETFSPATLYALRHVDKIYLIYTPNVYRQVRYALRVIEELDSKTLQKIETILVSAYNPEVTYIILEKRIQEDFEFRPKLTGPMPIYLALKKVKSVRSTSRVDQS